ncbi:transposase [Streptomyces sp. CBMA152]|uniref:transposase n=1 Tax=Streptomyces sp. CBMA152 TaxID=1896312 RepID=UPI002948C3BE|nr:transposase [Streptomyces sp. CBMA152]
MLAHHALGSPIVLIWDNLDRHTCAEMTAFVKANSGWLRVFQLPSYAPDLNPAEGIWSLLVRGPLANLAVGSFDELVDVIRQALKKIQYRPDLIDGCLVETGALASG